MAHRLAGFEINACPLARGKAEIASGNLLFSFTFLTGKLAKYSVLPNINKIISRRKLGPHLLQQNKMRVKKAFALFCHVVTITICTLCNRTRIINHS